MPATSIGTSTVGVQCVEGYQDDFFNPQEVPQAKAAQDVRTTLLHGAC